MTHMCSSKKYGEFSIFYNTDSGSRPAEFIQLPVEVESRKSRRELKSIGGSTGLLSKPSLSALGVMV
jgi:hypothetical protein